MFLSFKAALLWSRFFSLSAFYTTTTRDGGRAEIRVVLGRQAVEPLAFTNA
jgi:hypothetical protein